MGLRFSRNRGFVWESQASSILTQRVQAILEDSPFESVSDDTGQAFFETFGMSYARMYRTQNALAAVVNFYARNIGQVPMRVFARDEEGVPRHARDHPVQRLINRPTAAIGGRATRSKLLSGIAADRAVYDVSATWKIREDFDQSRVDPVTKHVRNRGQVVALVRIPIPNISIAEGNLVAPTEFAFVRGRDRFNIPAEDVIWMSGYSPGSNNVGTPPTEQLRQLLAEDSAASKNRRNFWERGFQGNLAFLQKGPQRLSDDAKRQFKASWREKFAGTKGAVSGEAPLFPLGIEPYEFKLDAESAQYLEARELTLKEVCIAYGIQPAVLGITQANFASADMWHQMLYQDALGPPLVAIQEEFEEQLLTEFVPDYDEAGFFIDFNINAKLQGSFLDQAKIGQQAVGGPWMTINEFREKFQALPPIEGGDEIIVPLNVVRGGGPQANPQDSAPDASGDQRLRDDPRYQRPRLKAIR